MEKIDETSQMQGLNSHANCVWGEVTEEDTRANFNALVQGGRLFSAFTASNGTKFWVITDAAEAGTTETTLMLPGEY